MTYHEFKNSIRADLELNPSGKTWKQLQADLNLPYKRPCPTWVRRLEEEIGLVRAGAGSNRAFVWRLRLIMGNEG